MYKRKKLSVYNITRKAGALIAPNRCPFCGDVISAEKFYCSLCAEYLPYVKKDLPAPENTKRLIACCYYRRRARKAVLSMKFGGEIKNADALSRMISERLSEGAADVIVPVPSSFKSRKKRGAAISEEMAKCLSAFTGMPYCEALGASDNKIEQKSLNLERRIKNAKSCFFFKEGEDVRGKRVLLLDDVCTTGSTLSAAAGLLLKAGAAEVTAAVFAKTLCTREMALSAKNYRKALCG